MIKMRNKSLSKTSPLNNSKDAKKSKTIRNYNSKGR